MGECDRDRLEGELMSFESSLRVVYPQWKQVIQTRHYNLEPSFKKQEKRYLCSSELDGITFTELVEDIEKGQVKIDWSVRSDTAKELEGVYFCIEFPEKEFMNGLLEFRDPVSETPGINILTYSLV
jgi:hypothetical protein